ncbi:hypothetical protein KJ996_02510 [Patescibacteria group bacterium]|nr:hypothetical protein [Patescibacteria group bacterium]
MGLRAIAHSGGTGISRRAELSSPPRPAWMPLTDSQPVYFTAEKKAKSVV